MCLRPPDVDEWLLPGHWEGNLIKVAFNRSAAGRLIALVSGLVLLTKMEGVTATTAIQGFSAALNRVPLAMRHAEITQKTGTTICFADPHSLWQ